MGALQEFYRDFKNLFGISQKSFADLQPEVPPFYSQLDDGTHSYNYELERHGPFSFLGFGDQFLKPSDNLKWYYEHVSFLADCVDIYADIAAQVQIQEINENGDEVEDSEFIKFLHQPNPWQDQIMFITEFVINTLTTGINPIYGNYFKNGNLRINPRLYNLDFFNLKMPKIKNPYEMTTKDIQDLIFKEKLAENKERNIFFYELGFVYDRMPKNTYGAKGYNEQLFLNPISRITSLKNDLQTIINSSENMAFLSSKKINLIINKVNQANQLAPLSTGEKTQIESKLGLKRTRLVGDVIATTEDLKSQALTRDVKKMMIVEMQNNAKENIRSKYGIPRDLLDAYTGTNSGATYENQQFAEARFTLNNVKSLTDKLLYTIESKSGNYFKDRKTKLIGKYEHMPSVIAINAKLKNEGFKMKAGAFMKVLEAYEKAKGVTDNYYQTFDEFLNENGFEEFLKTQKVE